MIQCFVILFLISNISCAMLALPEDSSCEWNGLRGKCVNYNRCLTAIKDVAARKYPPICSFQGNIPIICCTDCDLVEDFSLMIRSPIFGNLYKTGNMKAKDKCIDYLHTLDYKCKKDLLPLKPTKKMVDADAKCTYEGSELRTGTGFAVGGKDAGREEFPHMALLGFGNTIDTAQWLCGGSVISERFILTAAHCVLNRKAGKLNFVGLGILKRSDPPNLWQTYNVKRAIRHPDYSPPSKYHDIALLETDREITFSSSVLPACLNVDENERNFATATGWGMLGHNNNISDVLQLVQLRKYTYEKCSELYPIHRHQNRGVDTSTQICYGDIGTGSVTADTCQGDSGGPLQTLENTIDKNNKCVHTILGVTSYGITYCGSSNSASIYTRVKNYISWIEDIVWP